MVGGAPAGARVRGRRAVAAALLAAVAAVPPAEAAGRHAEPPGGFTLDGGVVPGAVFAEKAVPQLLVFSTLWCEVCRREQPAVERWAREHPGVETVLVVSGSPPERVRREAPARGLDADVFDVVVDPEGEIARHFSVKATPTFVLRAPGRENRTVHRVEDVPAPEGAAAGGAGTDGRGGRTPDSSAAPDAGALVVVRDTGAELGTSYDVVVAAPAADEDGARAALVRARGLCRSLEGRLSEWREDSEISDVNRRAGKAAVPVSRTLARLLRGAALVSERTDGAFDLTWRPLGAFWDAAERDDRWPSRAEVDRARERVDWTAVRVGEGGVRFREGQQLGIAGVAKGWIIDALFLSLREAGYENVVVNIGGDLRTAGSVPGEGRIRIADPRSPGRMVAALDVRDTAVATSGNYLRTRTIAGRPVGHIVDPRTGYPPAFEGSVTVTTRDAAMADALATALFVMGPEEGLALVAELEGVEAVYATASGLRASAGLEGRVGPPEAGS